MLHKDISINNGPHVWQWLFKIIMEHIEKPDVGIADQVGEIVGI